MILNMILSVCLSVCLCVYVWGGGGVGGKLFSGERGEETGVSTLS